MSICTSPHLDTGVSELFASEFEAIIESHSARVLSTLEIDPETKKLQEIFKKMRPAFLTRQKKVNKNLFHNIGHFLDVHRRLWIFLENIKEEFRPELIRMILLSEWALRHDDDHVGNTYRQDIVGGDKSNEEWAVHNFENDLKSHGVSLADGIIEDTRYAFYATSFGQSTLAISDPRHRDYRPKTPEQHILVLADIGAIILEDWNGWLSRSLSFMKEKGERFDDLGGWIDGELGFIVYVEKKLKTEVEIQGKKLPLDQIFKEAFRKMIYGNITAKKQRLNEIKEGKLPELANELKKELGLEN